jgi:hypothetical protein
MNAASWPMSLRTYIGARVGKPTMLDIQLNHCLSNINLISLFIKQTLHSGQFPYEKKNFSLFIFCMEILIALYY